MIPLKPRSQGCDHLFERHPEIIQRLSFDAPQLLPTLLDGLIWRSRTTINGQRRAPLPYQQVSHQSMKPQALNPTAEKHLRSRAGHQVNYYVKHLIQDEEGHFNQALAWIVEGTLTGSAGHRWMCGRFGFWLKLVSAEDAKRPTCRT